MNFLPFARRYVVTVPTNPARRAVTVPAMSMGPGRTILQDFEVMESDAVNFYKPNDASQNGQTARARLMMRYGWEKKGFLTESFHPVGSFLNKGRPLVPVWKFERPFRLNPGEELSATITAGGAFHLSTLPAESTPALMFNALRVKDNQPKMLYDVSRTVDTTGTIQALSFHCDADSPMLLYSVTAHDWFEFNAISNLSIPPWSSEIQIFSPGGREWLHYEAEAGLTLTAAQLRYAKSAWIEGASDRVDLGEQAGWVQESDEPFVIELMQQLPATSDVVVYVTLRGVLERPND